MERDVTTILNILDAHIRECQEDMDNIINYELEMADNGRSISNDEATSLNNRWVGTFVVKNLLTRIRDEII